MNIIIDTREKDRAIKKIVAEFDRRQILHDSSKLYVGDYMSLDNARRVVDRKKDLSELYQNMCHEGRKGKTSSDDQRFIKELERSSRMRICIVFLIEHGDGVKSIDDVKNWYNPQLDKGPYAWDGEYMHYRMNLLLKQYPFIRFKFCDKEETGATIIDILGKEVRR